MNTNDNRVSLEKSNSNIRNDESDGERGSVALIALLVIGLVVFYAGSGYQFVDADRHSEIHLPIIVILSIVGCFAIGCAVHMSAMGIKDYADIRADLETQLDSLARLIDETKLKMRSIENNSLTHFAGLSRRSQESIAVSRRIICALETRYSDVKQLLSTGNKLDLIDAYEVFNRRLVIAESSLTSLIDGDPLPALSANEWEPTLNRLVTVCDSEIHKLEAEVDGEYQHVG